MRMWKVDPKLLCRKHLLGAHVETHMMVGSIRRRKSIRGFIEKGLMEVHTIVDEHNILAKEMERRGFRHSSPLPEFVPWAEGAIDSEANLIELSRRCPDCKENITTL